MISKKVCLLGAFSVGKTSLVDQFVHSIFTERYLSTIGVKISKKNLAVDGTDVNLIIWDMEGKDIYADINLSYLRGAMGYFVVVDGTRKETLQVALDLKKLADKLSPGLPCYFLINKADREKDWEITEGTLTELTEMGLPFFRTSAKTGDNVEEAFACLTRAMLAKK